MRSSRLILFCFMAVGMPNFGSAQVFNVPTPDPQATAAAADFVSSGEPLFYWGRVYYPTGPSVFFDGNVMHRSGTFGGVPLYEDATLEPHSIMYVPIGSNLMRPYERRRDGDLAGTVGSRTPSFPVRLPEPPPMTITPPEGAGVAAAGTDALPGAPQVPVAALGDAQTQATGTIGIRSTPQPSQPARTVGVVDLTLLPPGRPGGDVRSADTPVQRARFGDGMWIDFDGRRWYVDGAAVSYDPGRFVPVGSYRGFPVYRDTATNADRIFVTVVPNGPVAPFTPR